LEDDPFLLGWYSSSHNHGSDGGKLPHMKGNQYWRDPFSTSMLMGGRVIVQGLCKTSRDKFARVPPEPNKFKGFTI